MDFVADEGHRFVLQMHHCPRRTGRVAGQASQLPAPEEAGFLSVLRDAAIVLRVDTVFFRRGPKVWAMAHNPIGTITDEERLVPLLTGDDGFLVDVTDPLQTADLSETGTFAWNLIEEGDVPRLAFGPVDNPDDAGDLFTGELSTTDERLTIPVSEPLLSTGLGLDTGAYDDDNPLLFEPDELPEGIAIGMTFEGDPGDTVESGIELRPVRYANGASYSDEPPSEATLDSDPVAEAELTDEQGETAATPLSEAISAPVDGVVIEDVLETADVSRSAVVEMLETISRRSLFNEGDDESESEPLVVDDRVVLALTDENWTETVNAELDADESTIEAVREIHARQADALLRQADADQGRFADRTPVVIEFGRHSESNAPPE